MLVGPQGTGSSVTQFTTRQIKDSLNIIPVEWVDEIVSLALEKEPVPLKKSNKAKKQKAIKSSDEKNQEKQTH